MGGLTRLLEGKLKLKVNREKSAVARPWERKFLGFSFTNGRQPKRRIAPKASRFEARVESLLVELVVISIETMVRELGRYLQGWQAISASARLRPCWTVSISGSGVVYALLPAKAMADRKTRYARLRELGPS